MLDGEGSSADIDDGAAVLAGVGGDGEGDVAAAEHSGRAGNGDEWQIAGDVVEAGGVGCCDADGAGNAGAVGVNDGRTDGKETGYSFGGADTAGAIGEVEILGTVDGEAKWCSCRGRCGAAIAGEPECTVAGNIGDVTVVPTNPDYASASREKNVARLIDEQSRIQRLEIPPGGLARRTRKTAVELLLSRSVELLGCTIFRIG